MHALDGNVTPDGNFVISAASLGTLASGTEYTVDGANAIGIKLVSRTMKAQYIKHDNKQLKDHLKVIVKTYNMHIIIFLKKLVFTRKLCGMHHF